MNLINILKLSKLIEKFAEVETSNGILICNGDLVEGVEVFVEIEGEVMPAEDGEYETVDKVIVVVDGKIAEIKDKEEAPAEEPAEEVAPVEEVVPVEAEEEVIPEVEEVVPEVDEKDVKIAELEARIAELEAENEALKAELNKATEELSKPVKTEAKLEAQAGKMKNYLKKN